MSPNASALVVMSKYPSPGRVKTRLLPALTAQHASELHRTFLLYTLSTLRSLPSADLILCFDPPDAANAFRDLLPLHTVDHFLPQSPGDLGARLAAATAQLSPRYSRLLFLGVDSPHLPPGFITAALDLITPDSISLGPTTDGGYWSLGLPSAIDAPTLLRHIDWSTGREAQQTLDNARKLNYTPRLAPDFWDIDHPADLRRLCTDRSTEQHHPALLSALKRVLPPDWFC